MIDLIKSALADVVSKIKTEKQRRQFISALYDVAREQEAISAAHARQMCKPASDRVSPRKTGAGPGLPPSNFIRIAEERGKLRIFVGRALWYELGSPTRMDVQRVDGQLWLVPAKGDRGFAVAFNTGMPRFWAMSARDVVSEDAGRYAAEIRGGVIVVGKQLVEKGKGMTNKTEKRIEQVAKNLAVKPKRVQALVEYDWGDPDHVTWFTTAPIDEVVSWAKGVLADEDSAREAKEEE